MQNGRLCAREFGSNLGEGELLIFPVIVSDWASWTTGLLNIGVVILGGGSESNILLGKGHGVR